MLQPNNPIHVCINTFGCCVLTVERIAKERLTIGWWLTRPTFLVVPRNNSRSTSSPKSLETFDETARSILTLIILRHIIPVSSLRHYLYLSSHVSLIDERLFLKVLTYYVNNQKSPECLSCTNVPALGRGKSLHPNQHVCRMSRKVSNLVLQYKADLYKEPAWNLNLTNYISLIPLLP